MRVLNLYHLPREQPVPPPGTVYIGRASPGRGLPQSPFANPFYLRPGSGDEVRAEVIDRYRKWLWGEIRAGRISVQALLDLRGKDLLCYCAPKACHGDVVAKAVQWAAQRAGLEPMPVIEQEQDQD